MDLQTLYVCVKGLTNACICMCMRVCVRSCACLCKAVFVHMSESLPAHLSVCVKDAEAGPTTMGVRQTRLTAPCIGTQVLGDGEVGRSVWRKGVGGWWRVG